MTTQPNQPAAKPRRRPRVFMWVILAVNALFAYWAVKTGADTTIDPTAAGLAALFILVLWAVVDVILGVLWLVTRRQR
jgi:hypothetical protein